MLPLGTYRSSSLIILSSFQVSDQLGACTVLQTQSRGLIHETRITTRRPNLRAPRSFRLAKPYGLQRPAFTGHRDHNAPPSTDSPSFSLRAKQPAESRVVREAAGMAMMRCLTYLPPRDLNSYLSSSCGRKGLEMCKGAWSGIVGFEMDGGRALDVIWISQSGRVSMHPFSAMAPDNWVILFDLFHPSCHQPVHIFTTFTIIRFSSTTLTSRLARKRPNVEPCVRPSS